MGSLEPRIFRSNTPALVLYLAAHEYSLQAFPRYVSHFDEVGLTAGGGGLLSAFHALSKITPMRRGAGREPVEL